ncbi:hypothetical protein EIK56_23845 [Sphingomonas sp. C8-2]|jgi:hypothetical protein|nr:hypothetical protein EIK56_23845 [Sphingomonas sp. C8-2]
MPDCYIMTGENPRPQSYIAAAADQRQALAAYQRTDPTAYLLGCDEYWKAEVARTLAKFPLTRVTERFYTHMLGILPPIYSRFNPGWFVGEAVVERVYTQFIEHNGRFYAGYANLGPGGRRWQIADIESLEATGRATEVDWFPSET